MKGEAEKLVRFMEGSDKRFVIPVYQRNYDWKIENCKQLYDDLKKLIKNGHPSHFFGSIVSVHDYDSDERLIIDGQQRLTTVSLLFLAMYNLLKEQVLVSENIQLSKQIFNKYLVDEYKPEETRIKLKPVKNDSYAYGKLFDEKEEHVKESNLTINYDYFYERIQKEEISIDELYSAIRKLEIINISLDPREDNPQLIFESLNSTGLALSEGDKIRNFILMGLETKQQEIFYEKYWNKIEINTNYEVSLFIRDYLSVKQKAIPSLNKVYFMFKNYAENREVEPLLKELLEYAKLYKILLDGKTSNTVLNACIYRLNRLETTVTRPFFLEVLRLYTANEIEMENVVEIFSIIESFLFRRTICELPTNSLNKIFLFLHKEIMRYDGETRNYVEKMKYALLSKKEKARFPEDEEFLDCFEKKQMYFMNSKNKIYLLERLENYGTKEDKDVYRHFDDGEYSIEHIMPQHLSPAWKEALGEDYENIHDIWLHRMANLTITAYNSKYSNDIFARKRDVENGFKDSGLRMNQNIAREEKWGLAELEKRNEELKNRALKIWELPRTEYEPEEKQMDIYSLEDETDLTGRNIVKFTLKNNEENVSSWAEMYQKVLQILHQEDKAVLTKLAKSSNRDDLSVHVSFRKEHFPSSVEIADGIHALTKTSTISKLALLRRFFALYRMEESDLIFYLENKAETDDNEEPGSSREIYKRYWTQTLEALHSVHGENCFYYVKSSEKPKSWIRGAVGHQGITIRCVANQNMAKVQFYIGSSNKDNNKKIYDYLYSKKDEIESKLEKKLNWDRDDDDKSSKIYVENSDLGIANENVWGKMTEYHVQWSKKFYDVFVPYVDEYMEK